MNTIEEAKKGIPTFARQPYFPKWGGCLEGCRTAAGKRKRFTREQFSEFGVAAFLVSFGRGSYYGFFDIENDDECGGCSASSWPYLPLYDEIRTGKPLGDAEIGDGGYTFTRKFERGTVMVNAADGTYKFDLE